MRRVRHEFRRNLGSGIGRRQQCVPAVELLGIFEQLELLFVFFFCHLFL